MSDLFAEAPASSVTLAQLAFAIREVLDDNFAGTHRITAEIASISAANARGHCYLELVDRDPRSGEEARLRANIWANRWRVIDHYFQQETGQRLAKGMQILLEGQLTYHPAYGLSLNILSIDATYTLGRQKQALEKILARLTEEGLMTIQKELEVEPVLQRIAVISSPSAAGYQDFVHQLEANPYGYRFGLTLFTAVMQGTETEASILNALDAIRRRAAEFDAVAVLRGGGADQDLVAFNSYLLGKALAEFPLPILTGIGHERDTTVPDLVAYQRLKTPTAVAEYLIEQAALYEGELDDAADALQTSINTRLLQEQNRLARLENTLLGNTAAYLPTQTATLNLLADRIAAAATRVHDTQRFTLESLEKQLHLLDPRLQLKRGFALVYGKKGLARKPADLKGPLRIVVEKGEVQGSFTPEA